MKDEHLLEAFGVWQELSQSPEERMAYISRLKYILDEEAKYDHARDEGEKAGIEKGIEQGIKQGAYQKILEIISNGIENKIPVEIIAVMTKLSIDEVQKIIKNNQLDQQE